MSVVASVFVVSCGYGFDSAWSCLALAEGRLVFLKRRFPTLRYGIRKIKIDPKLRRDQPSEGQP